MALSRGNFSSNFKVLALAITKKRQISDTFDILIYRATKISTSFQLHLLPIPLKHSYNLQRCCNSSDIINSAILNFFREQDNVISSMGISIALDLSTMKRKTLVNNASRFVSVNVYIRK